MKYYFIATSDQYHQNWVFYEEHGDTVRLRERYLPFQCPSCQKIDELAALSSGIDDDVALKGKGDVLHTHDGLLCMSRKLSTIIQKEKIMGLEFVETPGPSAFLITVPTELADVDVTKAGLQFQQPRCSNCGRWAGIYIIPRMHSITAPQNLMTFFAPNPWLEDRRGKVTWLYASEKVVKILKEHRVRGIYYNKA